MYIEDRNEAIYVVCRLRTCMVHQLPVLQHMGRISFTREHLHTVCVFLTKLRRHYLHLHVLYMYIMFVLSFKDYALYF